MSDEESFVILGSSPTPSMDTLNSIPTPEISDLKSAKSTAVTNGAITESQQLTTSSSSNASQFSIVNNGDTSLTNGITKIEDQDEVDNVSHIMNKLNLSTSSASHISKSNSTHSSSAGNSIPHAVELNAANDASAPTSLKRSSAENSLATSFILGEVDSDVLKASVYSQFPNICSTSTCAEDVVKLQNMMTEYLELKKILVNTNITMKQWYEQSLQWKEERKTEIAKLRNENMQLRKDLENKVELINMNEEARRKEHEEFVQNLSEKTAQIENMSAQILKLEQQQLASFEYIPKNDTEAKHIKEALGTEYVTTLEHNRIVKEFERKMSEIVAENVQIKDMKQNFIDEIDCLKVKLGAAEELLKKTQADINFLKAGDKEKSDMLTKFENEKHELKTEIDVLREQVEIYGRDFKMENEARENLANEKDQLLTDLRELQRKNQELIQEAQKNYEEHTRQVMSAQGAFPKTRTQTSSSPASKPNPIYQPTNYNCPICGKIFKTLSVLHKHANECLDGN